MPHLTMLYSGHVTTNDNNPISHTLKCLIVGWSIKKVNYEKNFKGVKCGVGKWMSGVWDIKKAPTIGNAGVDVFAFLGKIFEISINLEDFHRISLSFKVSSEYPS